MAQGLDTKIILAAVKVTSSSKNWEGSHGNDSNIESRCITKLCEGQTQVITIPYCKIKMKTFFPSKKKNNNKNHVI